MTRALCLVACGSESWDIQTHLSVALATSALSWLVCRSGLPLVCLPQPRKWNDWEIITFCLVQWAKRNADGGWGKGAVGLKSRAQTGILANNSGSHCVQSNQSYYEWTLPINTEKLRKKWEELASHCLWWKQNLTPQSWKFLKLPALNGKIF